MHGACGFVRIVLGVVKGHYSKTFQDIIQSKYFVDGTIDDDAGVSYVLLE